MSFEQKYHPTKLSEVVYPDAHSEKIIQEYASAQRTRSLLLHGAWGSGKTTVAKLIPPAFDINFPESPLVTNGYLDVMYLEGGSTDRSNVGVKKIKARTGTVCLNGSDMHYVIIDEADMLSVQYQGALKALMTDRPHVLFILTTNYIDKINGGILSRCEKVHLDPAPAERWMDRARLIFHQEKVIIPDERVLALLKRHGGDNRDILGALEDTVLHHKGSNGTKGGPTHVVPKGT